MINVKITINEDNRVTGVLPNDATEGVDMTLPTTHGIFTSEYMTDWQLVDDKLVFAPVDRSVYMQEHHVRQQRQQLLQASDWTQMPDVPLTPAQKQEWAVYRQALRDITTQQLFPVAVEWPIQPQR